MSYLKYFDVNTLNGNNGFTTSGLKAQDFLGNSVSSAGDINGDNKDDIIMGAPRVNHEEPDNPLGNGQAYVIFGSSSFQSSFDLSSLNGNNGFAINGTSLDMLGYSVSGIGDINGDGKNDIIVGAPFSSFNGLANAGRAYVFFGADSFPSVFETNTLNGHNGFTINGLSSGDRLGYSVSGIGDINGDGKNDIIIGAPKASPNNLINAGQAYVIFGSTSFQSYFNLKTLNGNNGFTVNGLVPKSSLGVSVSIGSDVNGDGKADIIIGANQASPNGLNTTGQAYVIFGASFFQSFFDLYTINGNNGVVINGLAPRTMLGSPVKIVPDINQDNKAEIIVGAVHASPDGITHAGQAYIIYGSTSFQTPFNVSELNGNNGFTVNGLNEHNALGWSVGSAYNVNGDSKNSIIIGALDASPSSSMTNEMMMQQTGQVYTIFADEKDNLSSYGKENVATIIACATIGSVVIMGLAYAAYTYTHSSCIFNGITSQPLSTLEEL